MPDELIIRRPDNFHVHLRRGPLLGLALPFTADVYARALVMPNTDPPVVDARSLVDYRGEIVDAMARYGEAYAASFTPLMTIKLTHETTPETVKDAALAGCVAVKLYPAGATTGSRGGIDPARLDELDPVLRMMSELGVVLSIHAEHVEGSVLSAEQRFVPQLSRISRRFPDLKIVVEHVSTRYMAETVMLLRAGVAATITPMHLTMTIDDILAWKGAHHRGLNPHNFCYPVPKKEADRDFLRHVVTLGNPRFFAGDDSAPHRFADKESPCGCAGAFSSPASLPTYAEVFEDMGALHRLEDFTSRFGAEFYGLTPNEGVVRLARTAGAMPVPYTAYSPSTRATVPLLAVRPWRAGETPRWRVTH